jgi:hypothetical protein
MVPRSQRAATLSMTWQVIAAPTAPGRGSRRDQGLEDGMNGFWKRWMRLWCWAVLVFGAVLALSATPGLDAAPRQVLRLIGGDPALLDQPALRFAFGLQGALTLGWGLTMIAMIDLAHTAGAPAWRSLTGAS